MSALPKPHLLQLQAPVCLVFTRCSQVWHIYCFSTISPAVTLNNDLAGYCLFPCPNCFKTYLWYRIIMKGLSDTWNLSYTSQSNIGHVPQRRTVWARDADVSIHFNIVYSLHCTMCSSFYLMVICSNT